MKTARNNKYSFYRYFIMILLSLLMSAGTSFGSQFLIEAENNHDSDQVLEASTGQSTKEEVEKAHDLLQQVVAARKFIDRLDQLSTVDLPIGISATKDKEGEKYAIIISDIIVRDGNALLNAYMAFTVPGTDKKIAFKGVNIPFSHAGGIKGTATLQLISDFEIDMTKDITLRLKGNGLSSVAWDCSGFKEMKITADLEFSNNFFIPENEDGTRAEGEKLFTSFQTTVTNWNNLMVAINLKPFQLKPLNGLGFKITNAILDMSDFANPTGVKFPESYSTSYFSGMDPSVWRGIYIQEAEIRLPSQFKKRSSTERLKFYAQHLIIDELGFTGFMGIENLMVLEEGDMNGWNFSVEDFNIEFLASRLVGAGFKGHIDIPQLNEGTMFTYEAFIGSNDQYLFNVAMGNDIKLPLWAADLQIYPNSTINIEVVNKKFIPSLLLNGNMSISPSLDKSNPGSKKLSIANIEFQGMRIQTIKPYFSIDRISFGSEQNKFSDFPVSIYKVGFISENERVGLELGLTVNFMGEKDGGIGGNGNFTVWGKQNEKRWHFDQLQVDKIAVDISKSGAFELHGEVMFIRGDATYGDGFKGALAAEFAGFAMDATALFGNVNGFRYWYADALVSSPAGIPAGLISLNGFGGGAFNRVRQAGVDDRITSEIGRTKSGIVYLPDIKSGLGLTASVKFSLTGSRDAMNGDARFGISFTTSGGINQIFFDGNAYFMTKNVNISSSETMKNAKSIVGKDNGTIPLNTNNAQLYGNINMLFDFPNRSFHSTFSIYINAAGGIIKGVNEGGLAGWGVVHFEPGDWYIHLGTPDKPNGISILGIAKMTSYFMAGKSVPELPLPPQQVMNSLTQNGKKYVNIVSSSTLGEGKGFALGAAFSFDTGERTFLIFYGRFGCGVGFDILLKNYGPNVFCEGRSGPIGINGWYAQGQAYAWIAAEVGIKVSLPFYKGKYSIFELEVAALLQAKAPNPFWMKGNVGGRFSILNGLVKGHCDFEFEIGEQCKLVSSSPFDGMPVISEIKPLEGEEDASVFTTPQIVFNMPVEEPFEFENEQKVMKTFKIKLREISIETDKKEKITGSLQWNNDKNVAVFKSKNILPGESEIKIHVAVSFEEYRNGAWFEVKANGKTAIETKSTNFRTGEEPDHIPQENVAFSYPAYRHFNYYISEASGNYITLDMGQPKLFNPGAEWKQIVRISTNTGEVESLPFNYRDKDSRIMFNLPGNLSLNTIFKLEIINIPTISASKLDKNVHQKIEKSEAVADNLSETEVKTQFAEGVRTELQEKVIYAMNFRTSQYQTFGDKLHNLKYSEGISWETNPLVHSLTVNITGERFDSHEVVNLADDRQVSSIPILDETQWFNTRMKPLFDLDEETLKSIKATGFKMPSLTSYFFQSDGTRALSDEEISSGICNETDVLSGMKYYLARYSCEYLYELKNHISNKYVYNPIYNKKLQDIMNAHFYPLTVGDYPVNIHYTLPGNEKPNSTHRYNIIYNDK